MEMGKHVRVRNINYKIKNDKAYNFCVMFRKMPLTQKVYRYKTAMVDIEEGPPSKTREIIHALKAKLIYPVTKPYRK